MKQLFVSICGFVYLQSFSQTTPSAYTQEFLMCRETGVDAYLASGAPSTNYGNHPTMGGNTWTCGGGTCNSRAIFYFPLPINTNSLVGADLVLQADINWGTGPTTGPQNSGWIKRVTGAWNEQTVTWANQPAATNVNQVFVPASIGIADNYVIDVTTLVFDMAQLGNNGLLLMMNDEVNPYKSLQFASSDNTSMSLCPKVIYYFGSRPVGIQNAFSNQVRHSIFRGPNEGQFRIQSANIVKKYRVFDVSGRLVAQGQPRQFEFEITELLEAGTYILQTFSEEGQALFIEKIMVY